MLLLKKAHASNINSNLIHFMGVSSGLNEQIVRWIEKRETPQPLIVKENPQPLWAACSSALSPSK